jgi:hypothetical protein
MLVAGPTMEIRPMDVCTVTFRGGDGPWGARYWRSEDTGAAGFLAWHGDADAAVCVVGQLNPTLVALIPAVEIEAMHRVVGSVGSGLKLQAIDMDAYFMIAGMAGEEAVKSFGPAPEMREAA